MEKVKDVITIENSFFGAMKENYADLYTKLFGEIEPSDMDMNLLVNCGERYCSPLLSHFEMNKVVQYVINKFGKSWERIKETLELEYDVLKPYSTETTTTGNKTVEQNTTGTSTDTSGIVGFDSDTATDSTQDTNTNTNTENGTETQTTTVTNGGNLGSRTNADLIANEIEMRKASFISLALNDIQTQLTLDIY